MNEPRVDASSGRFKVRTRRPAEILLFFFGIGLLLSTARPQAIDPKSFIEAGSPLIRNFTMDDYAGHAQNWAAVQDSRDVMYFGNNNGILEFDGRSWNLIRTPNKSIARSLALGPDGTIFFGASGDFGYLAADKQGKLRPVSLADKLKTEDRAFNFVWKTLSTPSGIYFLSDEKVFHYRQDRIDVISASLAKQFGYVIDGQVLLVVKERGLSMIQGNAIVPLPGQEDLLALKSETVCAALFPDRKMLIATQKGTFFFYDLGAFYDPSSRRFDFSRPSPPSVLTLFPSEAADYVTERNAELIDIFAIDGDRIILTTRKNGLVVIGRDGKIVRQINKSCGLLDDNVHGILFDRQQNLWAILNNGLSYIEIDSPVTYFNIQNGLPDYVLATVRHQGRFYAGTFNGIFYLSDGNRTGKQCSPVFMPVENCDSETWEFLRLDRTLLAATRTGVYQIRGSSATRLCDRPNAYCLGTSRKFPQHILVGLLDGLGILKISPSNNNPELLRSAFLGKVNGVSESIRKIIEDGYGNIWLTTDYNGLIRLKVSGDDPFRCDISRFGEKHGLPQLDWNIVHFLQNRLIVATTRGIYEAVDPNGNPEDVRFLPEKSLGQAFLHPPVLISSILVNHTGNFFVNSNNGIYYGSKTKAGFFRWEVEPFRKIPVTDLEISQDDKGILWVPTSKGLFRYDPAVHKKYDISFNTLIRKVIAGKNEVVLHGTQALPEAGRDGIPPDDSSVHPAASAPVLSYKNNSLTIEYAAAFFESSPEIRFRHMLQGFDRDWNDWSAESRSEYTNLSEGQYVFRVKAKNIYGRMGHEAVFRFAIRSPWYRTPPAYLLFIVCGTAFFFGVLKLYTLQLRKDKKRLEDLVNLRTIELKEASLTDPLTGLRNRRYMIEILNEELTAAMNSNKRLAGEIKPPHRSHEEKTMFGLFLIDIDHFKMVNDVYSHEAGDRFLKKFAHLLKSTVREEDTVMRIGGEEFLIVLKNMHLDYLDAFARKIMSKVRKTRFQIAGETVVRKTCSMGCLAFPLFEGKPDLINFEQAVMIADLGLIYAKDHGRNLTVRLLPGESLPKSAADILQMTTSLDVAVKQRMLKISTSAP